MRGRPVTGPLQCDLLYRVAQVHVRIWPWFGVIETIEARPGNPAQIQHAFDGQSASGLHFFLDLLVDGGFVICTPVGVVVFQSTPPARGATPTALTMGAVIENTFISRIVPSG
jgi:hypothetical protein